MPTIKVLRSSSDGNCYIIDCNKSILLIECGVPCHTIVQALGMRMNNVQGCLLSHIHKDHSRSAKKLSDLFGIPIISNKETIAALQLKTAHVITCNDEWQKVGDFKVFPFECKHDVPNYGYIIKHPAFGTILFATDTYAFPILFKGIDHYLIEANYSDELLQTSDRSEAMKERVLISHMSLDYTIKYLQRSNASETAKTITLIHLSAVHSNAEVFQKRVQATIGVPTFIADTGTEIDISKQ